MDKKITIANERLPRPLIQIVHLNRIVLHAAKLETHSADVVTLAPVFENSAIEPKPTYLKQKHCYRLVHMDVTVLADTQRL